MNGDQPTNVDRLRTMSEEEFACVLAWAYCTGFNNACNHIYDDPDYLDWLWQSAEAR